MTGGKWLVSSYSRLIDRRFLILLFLIALFTLSTSVAGAQSAPNCGTVGYSGSGTSANPWQVGNLSQLQCIGNSSTTTTLSDNFTQVSDIDASDTSAWNSGKGFVPIGNSTTEFTGTFNGSGFTVTGLYVNRSRSSLDGTGLFGSTGSSALIKNVGLENADLNNPSNGRVGGLVGNNDGTVNSSYATGNINGSNYVAGLVALNTGTVNSSYATGKVNGSGSFVGGLVGRNSGTVNSSYATGKVNGSLYVAGLVGGNGGTVNSSYATGNVSGSSNVGGLIGANTGTVNDGYWDVNTTNQSSSDGGTGLTTEEMKGSNAQTSMTGFDFTNTWDVVTGGNVTYPFLRNNTQTPAPGLESLYASGNGTSSNPYEISDWYHLDNVRMSLGANFTVVNDLNETTAGYDDVANTTANGGAGFVPIGDNLNRFTGTFDGQGYNITDLSIDRPSEPDIGLFGYVDGGTVTNVSVVDANVTGDLRVGGLAGFNNGGTVNSSYATGNVSSTGNRVGGLVGRNDLGTVRESYATANVSSGGVGVGGLVGTTTGTVDSAYATGNVNGSGTVGGLVGFNNGGTVDSAYTTGNVNGSSDVGGLVGRDNSGTVNNGYWDVNTTNQTTSAGGTGLTTSEMQGADAVENLDGFNFVGTWYATEEYPVLVRQGAGPLFAVNITGTNSPVNETEMLNVTTNVTNYGGESDTQTVNLTDTEFNNTERDNATVTLTSGESNGSVYLEWSTQSGDNGTGNVTVASNNDTDTANVTVQEPASFAVNITGTNSPVNETETLNVTANVTNTGEQTATQTITLNDTYNKDTQRDSVDITLAGGASNSSVQLQWNTVSGDNGTGNVTVASGNSTDTANVTVREMAFFDLDVTGTNSPVNETETLNVTVNVTNTGGTQGTQTVELADTDFSYLFRDNVTLTLTPGETQNTTLSWSTERGDNGTGNVSVMSGNTTDTANVTVNALPSFEVNITDTSSGIVEGENLTVNGTVENTGDLQDTQNVNLTDFGGVEQDNETFTLNGSEQGTFNFTWNTTVGENGTDNATVASENTTDNETVTVLQKGSFAVSIDNTNEPVTEGEELLVNVTVENTGEEDGVTQEVNLTDFNGVEQDNATFTLNGSEQGVFNFTWNTTVGENGTDNVTVASENTTDKANVTVLALASFDVNLTDTNLPVDENEVVEVDVNVTNEGDLPGTEAVELMVDGKVVDNDTLTLAPGDSGSVTLEWQTESGDGGSSSISIAGENDIEVLSVQVDGLLQKRETGRGQIDETRDPSRDMGRDELGQRDDLYRDSGRNTNSNRRDRSR